MINPTLFFSLKFSLFFKKQARITCGNYVIFMDKLGRALRLKIELMPLENIWDEKVLQTLKSKGYINLEGGCNLIKIGNNICFEQITLDALVYTKTKKNLSRFFREFFEYKTIFSCPSF